MGDTAGGSGAAPSLPKGGGALQGIGEKFAPDLHTGTGNFTIPLAVPRGRNGFQPQLTLAYSSGSGNGPFGLGWSLNVPGVSRKTSAGVPRYDDAQDTFLLSGAEDLVPVARNGATVRYRPRTEGLFARIERRHGATDDYWEVRTKDGHVSHYGTPQRAGTDPAAVADPADRRKVFCWKLSLTTDPFGNRVEYEYERDAGTVGPHRFDQLYLRRIRYADYTADGETRFLASVTFVYEDVERPDPYSEYRAGFEMRTRKRCARIETRTHAGVDRLVRSVRFTYLDQRTDLALPGPLNGASLLNRITIVGHDGELTEPLPPLEFDYTRFEPHKRKFSAVQGADLPARSLLDRDLALIDLDGNGLPDIIEMNGSVRTWRNLGNGRFDRPRAMTTAPAGLSLAAPGVRLLDADGDGRSDLMVVKPELAGYFPLGFDGAWNQRSFRRYRQAPSFDLADPEVRLLDLTGDGITDALRSGTRLECFFNDAEAGWTTSREVERQAIEAFPNVNFSDPRVRFADMSGDGLTDIVLVHDGSVAYWPSLGHGDWGSRIAMRQSPRFPEGFDPRRILVGDVDGDGLADLIYVDDRRVTLWINRSGGAWSPPIEIRGTPRVSDLTAVQLVDLAGSGVAGLLWSSDADGLSRTGMYFLDFTGGTKPYLLDAMDNHMGAVTRVSYAPSTRFYLQDARRRETRWKTTLPFPVQVVARVEVFDAISGGKLTIEYSYHHGYWDGVEREFRGFGRVEQRDTEVFDNFHAGGSATGRPFAPVAPRMFSPPLETRTWFHQGPVDDGDGDWKELDCTTEFSPHDPPALARPQATVDLLARLPRRARRDALRTLRGSVRRAELYALDGSEREERPYTVTESVFGVREESVPALGEDVRSRIFFPFNAAQRTTQWERGDDPMTRFAFTDDYDQYGQPGSLSSIAVPRGRNYRIAGAPGEPYLATHTANTYANRDDAQRYMGDRAVRLSSYEIPNDGSSSLLALHAGIVDGSASRRLIAQQLEFYDGEAFVGLPFGQIGEHGIVTRTESLAMSEAMLQDAYRSDGVAQASPERPSYLVPDGASWAAEYPQEFRSLLSPLAGYVFQSGDPGSPYGRGYFATTRRRYDCQDEAAVRPRGLLESTRDPLGCDTTIAYDEFALLPVEITRAAALTRRVAYDYRLLQPHEIVDPNGNRSLATYTPLGLLAATALMGKPGEDVGDTPDSPSFRLTYDWLAFIERGQPVSVRTIRRVHHAAETDVPLPRRDDTIETVEYTDGFGRPLQSRTLADDVVFGDPVSGDPGLPASLSAAPPDAIGREPAAGSPPRVLVSGWQVYDNKGRVVERYEPFLSMGFDYGTPGDLEFGQKAVLFYDPRGQGIRTVNPDGSEQRVILGVPSDLTDPERFAPTPWEVYTYDANDNAGRTHADAAAAYGHHWNTPASVVLDALGRAVASVTRNGPEADTDWFVTRSSYDIHGNLLTVTDASGRVAFRYVYDFANRVLRIESIDAGTRRIVFDAGGNEVERRDGKGALLLRGFDALQRPIRMWARDAAAEDMTLRERAVYGDAADSGLAPDHARAANLLGKFYRHYDEAGLVTFESYDFRGNVLEKVRRVVADAAILSVFEPERADRGVSAFRVNWQPPAGTSPQSHAESLLDATEYRISTAFDALGLLKTLRYPDDVESRRRELRPGYDRSAALVRVELDGATFVERIAYNARGQRTLVAYGNGTMTRYAYDAKTFRPTRLRSERFIRSSPLTFRPSGAALQDLAYDYDLVGNIMAIRDRAPESGVPNTSLGTEALDRTFAYDPLYRLLSATGRESDAPPPFPWDGAPRGHDLTRTRAYTEGYQYDREGNLTRLRHLADGGGFTRELILAPGSNRLATTSVGDDRLDYGYDANGNLIGETTSRHFEWDHSDRMRVFRVQAGDAAPSLHAHYLYDSTGSRVKKLVRKQSGAVETTVYVDGIFEHQRLREGKAVTENNTLHVKDDERRIALVRVGTPFPDDATPAVKYHLPDHLGSSSVVVDDAGAFVNREEFTPYGQTSFGGFARKRYRFTGKERDEESGLNYHQARYYAPWLGRWTSCDPAGLRGGSNLYAYARANPLRFVDPSGLQPLTPQAQEWASLSNALINTKAEMTFAAQEFQDATRNYQRLLDAADSPADLLQDAFNRLSAAEAEVEAVRNIATELGTGVSQFSQRNPGYSTLLVNDLFDDLREIEGLAPSRGDVIAAGNLLLPGGPPQPPRGRPPAGAPPPPTTPGGNGGRGGGSPSSGSSPDAPSSIADDVGGSSLSAPREEIPSGSKVSSHTPHEGGGTKVHAPKGGSKIVKALGIAAKVAGPVMAGYAISQGDYLGAARAVCPPLDLALMPIDALLWMQETAKTVPSTPPQTPDYYKEAGWDDSAILMPMGAGGGGGLSHSALQW